MIGYSNLSNLFSTIKFFYEFRIKKLEISIIILKNFENLSSTKLSKNTLSVIFKLLKIIAITIIIINKDKLKTKLKLFLINTPNIKVVKIDNERKISGNSMFKLFIIYFELYLKLNLLGN